MIKPVSFFWGVFLFLNTMGAQAAIESQKTQTESPKTVIIDIPSDLPPSPSAEAIVPHHLFSDETPGYDAFQTGEEQEASIKKLEERIQKLEERTTALEQKGL